MNRKLNYLSAMLVIGMLMGFYLNTARQYLDNNYHYKFGPYQTQTLVMYAGQMFAEHGFWAMKFTPLIPGFGSHYESIEDQHYTHFPPLPYYIGGFICHKTSGSLNIFRMFNILMLGIYLIGVFCLVNQLFSFWAGFWSLVFIIGHKIIYQISIISPEAISDVFEIGSLCFIVYALQNDKKSYFNTKIVIAWIFTFLNAYSSFEHIISSFVIQSLFLIYWRPRRWVIFITGFAIAPILAFGLHFINNAWVLGGMEPAYLDLKHAFLSRTLGSSVGVNHIQIILGDLMSYPKWLIHCVNIEYFNHNGWLFIIFFGNFLLFYFFSIQKKMFKFILIIGTIFFLGSVSFWFVFQELTVEQFFMLIGRHWILFYSGLFGSSVYFLILEIKKNRDIKVKIFALMLLGLCFSILGINFQNRTHFLKIKQSYHWQNELKILKRINAYIKPGSTLYVLNQDLSVAAYIHQPRNQFKLSNFKIKVITDWDQFMTLNPSESSSYFMMTSLDDPNKVLKDKINRWIQTTQAPLLKKTTHFRIYQIIA